jgi:hypothetical protein
MQEPHQRHSSLARAQDQLGRGQIEVEIHATAMPRLEGVISRARALGEQGRKGVRGAGMISVADLIHAKV